MYNETDGDGWCFSAYCTQDCEVKKLSRPCLQTTTPVPITTTPEPAKDCYYLKPPRKDGEQWKSKCVSHTCDKGRVITEYVSCKKPAKPRCENKLPPVRVYDEDGCCFHYKCRGTCTVLGNTHYFTFDNHHYTFQENCTYVLVKETVARHNFTVHINNVLCNSPSNELCSRSLFVYYTNYKIVLSVKKLPTFSTTVLVNDQRVTPAYSNDDFTITSTGIMLLLKIPAIGATVVFKGLLVTVDLPFSLFSENTEGLCGTFDNNKENDCKQPNGTVHSSCSYSGSQWQVSNDTECNKQPPPVPPTTKPCNSKQCDILLSKVFEKCHKKIPPKIYHDACVFDVCRTPNNNTACSSVEAYALACTEVSICVDWRNATDGLCKHNCPKDKVYKACGSPFVPTCNTRYNDKYTEKCPEVGYNQSNCQVLREGCYCPEGKVQFSPTKDVCVASCCTGPKGEPMKVGETWKSHCSECVCDKDTMSVKCSPVKCPLPKPLKCNVGETLELNKDDCCKVPICVCNKLACQPPLNCKPGFEVKVVPGNGCCTVYKYVPKNVCVHNETEYKPGMVFQISPCTRCHCTNKRDPKTVSNRVVCSLTACSPCAKGWVNVPRTGQCCGTCVKTSCLLERPGLPVMMLNDSQSFTPPNDRCTKYTCSKKNGDFITVKHVTKCPPFNAKNCVPGTEQSDKNGCCKTCTPREKCEVNKKLVVLKNGKCKSVRPVELTSCSGKCGVSASEYSVQRNKMFQSCLCCKELSTVRKRVTMNCGNGKNRTMKTLKYIYVNSCSCQTCGVKSLTNVIEGVFKKNN